MPQNILNLQTRAAFRAWLMQNAGRESECYLTLKRGRPQEDGLFYYIDAVEEALCFGWVDSTLSLIDGVRLQRFAPRAKNSHWTELNKARGRRLEKLGLMTEAGRAVLPDMAFRMDESIEAAIREANLWESFTSFPDLYQRVRASNLADAKRRSSAEYEKAFAHFVQQTKAGKMYGEWNDYGRLV